MNSPTSKGSRPSPPPPFIGRAGNLTIFITPPPRTTTNTSNSNPVTPNPNLCPVQAPPIRWEDDPAAARSSLESVFEFLWSALAKAQDVHSSLDSYVADWFGLNHSKYQRELNDYYERTQKPLKNEFGDQTQPKDDTSKIEAL